MVSYWVLSWETLCVFLDAHVEWYNCTFNAVTYLGLASVSYERVNLHTHTYTPQHHRGLTSMEPYTYRCIWVPLLFQWAGGIPCSSNFRITTSSTNIKEEAHSLWQMRNWDMIQHFIQTLKREYREQKLDKVKSEFSKVGKYIYGIVCGFWFCDV